MKIKLILARTNHDAITARTDTKTVEVNLPLVAQEGWNVVRADWEYDIIHRLFESEVSDNEQQVLEDLAAAIVIQAADNYRDALVTIKHYRPGGGSRYLKLKPPNLTLKT